MKDVKVIVADTLRTMMGAAAADPYVRAIERALDVEEDNHLRAMACAGCGSMDHAHNIERHKASGVPIPKPGAAVPRGWRGEWPR